MDRQTAIYWRVGRGSRRHVIEWLKVSPLTGPLDGGTLLTVQGTNLGRSLQQVESSVTVAGVKCELIPEKYIVSNQ